MELKRMKVQDIYFFFQNFFFYFWNLHLLKVNLKSHNYELKKKVFHRKKYIQTHFSFKLRFFDRRFEFKTVTCE